MGTRRKEVETGKTRKWEKWVGNSKKRGQELGEKEVGSGSEGGNREIKGRNQDKGCGKWKKGDAKWKKGGGKWKVQTSLSVTKRCTY